VRGFRSTFRRFRAGGMSSSAFSCDGGGVGGRQVAGRIGELGGELSGELGMELRGEERSEAASKYMESWEGSSGRCISELFIVFSGSHIEFDEMQSRTRRELSPHDSFHAEGLRAASFAGSKHE
jgi:hypothetical protein